MEPKLYDDLQRAIETDGAQVAIDKLCDHLRESKDYTSLFYALLMKKRQELGVSPMPTGPAQDLPAEMHGPYEDAIREAGREVGQLYLKEGNIPEAFTFFNMLGEIAPVAEALEKLDLPEDEDCQPVIEIALNHGAHPKKGFDLIVDRYGICSAITTLSGMQFPPGHEEFRDHCIKKVIRTLHDELTERLKSDITQQQSFEPTAKTVPELIEGRDWLFAEDMYHVDVSHLSSVVQFATNLGQCEELDLARQLCKYGEKLSGRFQFPSDPPFENQYVDYGVYLDVLAGEKVDEGIAHFRKKAEDADPDEIGTFPAEVLVNLLLRIGRKDQALEVARQFLKDADSDIQLSCPPLLELCQQTNNFAVLAEVARENDNPVHFLAGLIAVQQQSKGEAVKS